jgi:hypothetical protein
VTIPTLCCLARILSVLCKQSRRHYSRCSLQIGVAVPHDAPVWKLQWSSLGLDLAVSCIRTEACPPAVYVWRINILGEIESEPAAVMKAGQ